MTQIALSLVCRNKGRTLMDKGYKMIIANIKAKSYIYA